MDNAYLPKEERDSLIENNNYVYIPSKFQFLQEHKGLRPCCMHVLLGNNGTGKTALTKAIEIECAKIGRVYHWSSEENKNDFRLKLSEYYPGDEVAENIKLYSEQDDEQLMANHLKFLDQREEEIMSTRPVAVFIDNITTSSIYNGRIKDQPAIAHRLKNMCKKAGCPFFIVAHTGKDVSDQSGRLIEDTDIRDTKTLVNICEYLYIIQRFEHDLFIHATLRIRKHRKHNIKSKLFLLNFSTYDKVYKSDKPIPFKEFKEIFKKRNKL